MPTLTQIVGAAAANYNMVVGQPFPGLNPYTGNNDAWTFNQSSISGGVSAPDGTTSAQHLTEDGSNAVHSMAALFFTRFGIQTLAWPFGVWRYAAILKAAERTRAVLLFGTSGGGAVRDNLSVGFDLAGGNVGYDNAATSGSVIVATNMTALGSGWYLCWFDFTMYSMQFPTDQFGQPTVYIDNGSGTAARSTTYTGNGTNGVDIWWASLLPSAVWSLNNQVFLDDFTSLSTVDINNTGAPGYNWYLKRYWPDNSSFAYGLAFFGNTPSPYRDLVPSDITQSGTVLTLLRDRSGGNGCFNSAAPVHPNGYVGNVWGYPAIFEGSFKWDMSALNGHGVLFNAAVVAFWGMSIEFMTGRLTTPSVPASIDFREVDFIEAPYNRVASALHNWSMKAGTFNDSGTGSVIEDTNIPIIIDFSQFHRYANIVIPAANNGGSYGLILTIYDGLCVGIVWYGRGIFVVSDPAKPPIGAGLDTDTYHQPILIDVGALSTTGDYSGTVTDVPLNIDWVRVFQGPSATLAALNIHDSSATLRQTQATDQSNIGAGPWEGGRFPLDGVAGVIQGSTTSSGLVVDGSALTLPLNEAKSSSVAQTSVASSASSVTLLANNPNRVAASIFNESTQILYLLLANTGVLSASTTNYTIQLAANARYELPNYFTGPVYGIWAVANGFARITEMT